MNKESYIYILTNYNQSTFYIGVTSNLEKRIYEHKNNIKESFSSKYELNKLVYYELFNDINDAIIREKQLKNWKREWKIDLIRKNNPEYNDLSENW